jgi:OOP family OmpA-OmpF porin
MYATERNLHAPKSILATTKFRTKQLCGTPEFNLQTTKIFLEKNMKLMKLANTLATTGLLALTTIAGNLAVADDADVSGWYVGGNIGQSTAEIDEQSISDSLMGAGLTVSSFSKDDSDTGYKLFGGYQFSESFALEGGYFDLGEFGYTASTVPAGTLSGDIAVNGMNIDAVGIMPFTENFSLIGRIGLVYAEAETEVFAANFSENDTSYKYGAGLQYDFSESFGARFESERYRIDDAIGNTGDIDLLSLGLVYRFGGSESKPAAVVPPVKTEQYCSILDIQYEINQDEIQREEQERLSVVAIFLKKYPNTTAVIEGHADNVGTPADNMKLSQRRAQSVVSYLVDKHAIAASRLQAVGYGDTQPLFDNSTEKGKRSNRRIGAVISCATDIEGLQPIPARITMAMDMEFGVNKADVKPEYREELRKVANYLKANPTVTATVEGHTANLQATPKLAMEMSQKRAQNVVNYLVDNFEVPRSRLTAQGFGENRRAAYNTSSAGQQDNRRVNIILNYPQPTKAQAEAAAIRAQQPN